MKAYFLYENISSPFGCRGSISDNNWSVFSFDFWKNWSIALLLIFSAYNNVVYGLVEPSLKTWIDFIEENDTAFVKGLFVNLSETSDTLHWQMDIHKETAAGSFDGMLKDTFLSEPLFPLILAETQIDLKKREYVVIIFNVFDLKNNLLATDTLTSQEIDPTIEKPQPVLALKKLAPPIMSQDAIEIDGLVLDETRTKIGRDFYEMFFTKWSPPAGAKDFLITIKEFPSRGGFGARVSIDVNGEDVLYRFIQPRADIVEQQAELTIDYLKNYLLKNENLKKSLDSEDAVGSGIY